MIMMLKCGTGQNFFITANSLYSKFTLTSKKSGTNIVVIKRVDWFHVCPPVRKMIHSLKLVDYLHVQADNPWYNYYITCDP